MARIRTVKPEFWTSAQILECSRNARLMFIGLFNFADDKGRHPTSAKQIKAEIFPADELSLKDILGMIHELSTNDLITLYTVDNKEYLSINGWHHQRIDKPQPPKYPEPIEDDSTNDLGTFPPDTILSDTILSDGDVTGCRKESQRVADIKTFEQFWNIYPIKKNKKKSQSAWDRLSNKKKDLVLSNVEDRSKNDPEWLKDQGKFIPHPTTYLNGERWEDDWKPKTQTPASHKDYTGPEDEPPETKIAGLAKLREQMAKAGKPTDLLERQIEQIRRA